MSTIHLLHYNNYYNRLVKLEDNLSAYQACQVRFNGRPTDPNGNTAIIEEVNFVDGDFVDTELVVNWQGDLPNYLLVVEDAHIKTRWFVVNAQKTRGGQLSLTLHRDLVADYYSALMDPHTSIFVEKATLPASNDLIFNHEDMSFNQIKTRETLIKDATECPWICIYAASKNADGSTSTFEIETGEVLPISRIFDSEQEFNNWILKRAYDADKVLVGGSANLHNIIVRGYYNQSNSFRTYSIPKSGSTTISGDAIEEDRRGNLLELYSGNELGNKFQNTWDAVQQSLPQYYSEAGLAFLMYDNEGFQEAQNNPTQYIRVNTSTGPRYYKVRASTASGTFTVTYSPLTQISTGDLWGAIYPALRETFDVFSYSTNKKFVDFRFDVGPIKQISISEITDSVGSASLNVPSSRYHLGDAPYDLFCIPLGDELNIQNSSILNFKSIKANSTLALNVATAFLTKYAGSGTVYDAQILPYCPLRNALINKADGVITLDLQDGTGLASSPIVDNNNKTIGYIFHATSSSFSFEMELEDPLEILDYKIESECDLYRLCSPNYSGIFEFNAAKNGGVRRITIQCTYKPYTPYIKLFPTWGRLYGENFSDVNFDARGLVCGGDFSLPATTSAWATYELQNKNYQLTFDRQIQNLEVNNAVQREKEAWGIAAGTVGAAVQGGSAGLTAGGPVGAVAGAVVGGALSLIGGLRDRELNDRLRAETIDYAKDQFGYQLGNIKALPQSLSKVSAYNVDNKYFPFLEYYTCSEVEKQALRDKIKYNGMTVMTIGTMREYVLNYSGEDPMYFKGKLIRLADFDGDYHILNALAAEINKGVFIP